MSNSANEQVERDGVDLLTHAMFSLDFLRAISDSIFSARRNDLAVGRFYDAWLKGTGRTEDLIPFSPGIILGYMYVGILFAKENWFDLLPDIDSVAAGTEWGLEGLRVVAPKEVKPSLKYVVRRIRNALGHGRVVVNVPGKGLSRENMLHAVTVTFQDENQRDPSDKFEAELSLDGIIRFVRKFQSVVHKHVRDKYRI